MNANYYAFTANNNYYAIDTKKLVPMQLSREAYDFLGRINNEKDFCLGDYKNYAGYDDVNALAMQSILFSDGYSEVQNTFRELNISMIPVLDCNLNCRYCYSSRKNDSIYMPIKRVRDAIDFFCNNYTFSFCRIDFVSGGEPLYDKAWLKEVVHIISDKFTSHNKRYLFWLSTNAMLLDDEILEFLDSKNFNLGISLDGPKSINDANRVDHLGNGTYDHVSKKVNHVLSKRNLSRNIKNLWNNAVLTRDSDSFVNILRNSYTLGFRNLQMKIVWSNDEALRLPVEVAICRYRKLTEYLFQRIEQEQISEFLCICNENDTYGKFLLRILIQSGVTRRCNAGANKFSISPEGKLYPCDSFLGIEEYCIGDIYTGFNEMYSRFKGIRSTKIAKCSECWAQFMCGGDCFYHSYINSGDPLIPDEKMCQIVKSIIEMCIELIVSLYVNFPERMSQIYNILAKRTLRMEPINNGYDERVI